MPCVCVCVQAMTMMINDNLACYNVCVCVVVHSKVALKQRPIVFFFYPFDTILTKSLDSTAEDSIFSKSAKSDTDMFNLYGIS